MPARLSGSAPDSETSVLEIVLASRFAQGADGFRQSKLFAREASNETAAADLAARLELAIDIEELAPGWQPIGLPLEQAPEHDAVPAFARGHRLDLRAQSLHRVPVDPGEQPALAPFIDRCARGEAPAQCEAFYLECGQRGADLLRLKPERIGQGGLCDGSLALEPAPSEFDKGRLGQFFLLCMP